jgi:sulfatase modifying factor 1
MIAVPGGGRLCLDRTHVAVGAFAAWADTQPPTTAEREGGATFRVGEGFRISTGASFRAPHGDGALAPADHPVTQITALEAEGFCASRGARLPTEDEWERAARNGREEPARYPWGDDITDERGAWRANAWQGSFPDTNTLDDGFLFAAPVGSFPPTPLGFLDLVGNVWHWTATAAEEALAPSPALPLARGRTRILRGGSFLCEAGRCHGYRIDARQRAEENAALVHVGFRCAL